MNKFEKNLAIGVEFEDFIDNSKLLYDLFPNIHYIDSRNHALDTVNHKGPRLKVENNDYELPDFQIFQNGKMSWVEAKSKPSGSFKYNNYSSEDYYSMDGSKYNSYEYVAEITNADELYFLIGDLTTNLIYLYKKYDFRERVNLKRTGYSPLYPATDEFLVAKIIDYSNNTYEKIIK